MGQLSKAKIDRIQKLRKKGYLQTEVAQMVGVNIKTVRTYDPVHMASKSRTKPLQELEGQVLPIDFYGHIRSLADWITVMYLYALDPHEIPCPHCFFPPSGMPKKKTTKVILKMLDNGDYQCPACGEILICPPRLAWCLLVIQSAEELRREGLLPTKGEAASQA